MGHAQEQRDGMLHASMCKITNVLAPQPYSISHSKTALPSFAASDNANAQQRLVPKYCEMLGSQTDKLGSGRAYLVKSARSRGLAASQPRASQPRSPIRLSLIVSSQPNSNLSTDV